MVTRSTNKPKRHPTFTLTELKAIRWSLTVLSEQNSVDRERNKSALEKIANAIAYREDVRAKLDYIKRTAREAKDHG